VNEREVIAMRKGKYLFLAFLGVAVGAIWFCITYRPFDAVSPLSYHRIELGCTSDDVRRIIGVPQGDHGGPRERTGGTFSPGNIAHTVEEAGVPLPDARDRFQLIKWWGVHYVIYVAVDENGVVVGKYLLRTNR
jgi:hypothetical protein